MTEETNAPESEAPASSTSPSFEELREATQRLRSQGAEQAESEAVTQDEAEPEEEAEEEEEEAAAEEAHPQPAPEPAQGKRDKKAIRIPLEVAERDKAKLRERNESLENELAEERKKNAKLAEFITKATGAAEQAPEEEEEILDEALDRRINKRLGKIEQTIEANGFTQALERADALGNSSFDGYEQAVHFVVAHEAARVIAVAKAKGAHIDDRAAIEKASGTVAKDLQEIYKETGGAPDALAAYVIEQAKMLGFAPDKAKAAPKKTKVNMEAAERARREAGAPTYQRESAKLSGDWGRTLVSRAEKQYGDESAAKRLAAFGINV